MLGSGRRARLLPLPLPLSWREHGCISPSVFSRVRQGRVPYTPITLERTKEGNILLKATQRQWKKISQISVLEEHTAPPMG